MDQERKTNGKWNENKGVDHNWAVWGTDAFKINTGNQVTRMIHMSRSSNGTRQETVATFNQHDGSKIPWCRLKAGTTQVNGRRC